ncbi:ShlB/FhaC/HecB family hemolysin secretion/activation protein [Pseudomonas sp. BP8]|uniref:ShlB/FhaC/HecB family hemolysin secretion/activation protein n=1 Tax=Pseudomonas sp. BP8 TaxID=2817864 RepID=UPI001AE5AE4D|nr:ShlB/FhaC/HecB family hemolysin secretion/activation protein [Pseudomonas sp. BP8]MBP2264317.1 hemolysin activation/secretion protein [Pseudomonas sp. BP8]HDS1735830.1 ShlB/FhaC/HecB family hemolysin secretion/activation protein [Pseudomonas putida]
MRRLLLILLLSSASLAGAEPLPSYLSSNDTDRRLPARNLPVDVYRPASMGLQVAAPEPVQQQALPMNSRIPLRKVRFEGGTVYPLSDLREHYRPLIGRQVSLAELTELTQRLTKRYQQDGYLLSYAYLPAQDFADGRVRVVLVEGYVRDYQLQGDIGPAADYLEQVMARLKAERPLTRKSFVRYTSLISRIPGVTTQAQLLPPRTGDGGARLIVQAARAPFTRTMTLNDGSRDDLQALIGVTSNAQTRFAEQLSASVLVPPGEEQARYWRLGYSQYLDSEGSQLLLSASRYRSEPSTRIRQADGTDLTQRRDSQRYSMGISQALIAAPGEWLDVVGRFYLVSERNDYEGLGVAQPSTTDTDMRALSFEGDWRRAEVGRLRMVSAGVYQGLDYLGARSNGDYDLDFLRVRLSALQSDAYGQNWQGVASAALYWSRDSLPDSEQVLFGGQNFGRGYPRDQAGGDKGWGLGYELNYSFTRDGSWVRVLQPYVAVDAARAWFNELQVQQSRLSSAALGVRVGDARSYNIALEVAKPLSDVALDSLNRRPRMSLSFSFQL